MNINIRADDTVEIDGYVNAVERNSKPLWSRIGQFIERVCKGAFTKALRRNEDVLLLLNHNPDRILARTSDDSLELREDSIGLHARAVVSDPEVVEKARSGDLVGWSFGFYDTPDGVENGIEQESGLPLRKIRDLDLTEVSILDKRKTPAYDGTLVEVRDDEKTEFRSEAFIDDINVNVEEINETVEERNEPEQEHAPEAIDVIDYSKWDAMIAEMKGERE